MRLSNGWLWTAALLTRTPGISQWLLFISVKVPLDDISSAKTVCRWDALTRFLPLCLEGCVCLHLEQECRCKPTPASFIRCLWRCCLLSQQWGRQEEDPVGLQQRLFEWRSPSDPTQGLLETEDLPEGRVTHEQAVCIHAANRCGNTILLIVPARDDTMHNE